MAHDCGNCGGCTGGCAGCGGCRGALELNAGELEMLDTLARIPFLPVARRADSEEPVYLESTDATVQEYALILLCLLLCIYTLRNIHPREYHRIICIVFPL